ncbi:MAG: transport-associated periplasmic or secreted lipoprotein [Phenylobacterium sp.]|nr:transport-associated periplasmic or secreted lipoprotein [Phenylobacterium sp.]
MANGTGDQERKSEDVPRRGPADQSAPSPGEGYGASLAPGDYRADLNGRTRSWTGLPGENDIASDHDGWNPGPDADDALHGASAGLGPDGWRRTDERLRETICEQLWADRILDAHAIKVGVEEGVVTLVGEVRHASDVRLAEILTREAAPGAEVRNQLRGPDGR